MEGSSSAPTVEEQEGANKRMDLDEEEDEPLPAQPPKCVLAGRSSPRPQSRGEGGAGGADGEGRAESGEEPSKKKRGVSFR